jgi:hypothetical protein
MAMAVREVSIQVVAMVVREVSTQAVAMVTWALPFG